MITKVVMCTVYGKWDNLLWEAGVKCFPHKHEEAYLIPRPITEASCRDLAYNSSRIGEVETECRQSCLVSNYHTEAYITYKCLVDSSDSLLTSSYI